MTTQTPYDLATDPFRVWLRSTERQPLTGPGVDFACPLWLQGGPCGSPTGEDHCLGCDAVESSVNLALVHDFARLSLVMVSEDESATGYVNIARTAVALTALGLSVEVVEVEDCGAVLVVQGAS